MPGTVTASSGENRVVQIGSGETYEDMLLDQSASGASITLRAVGSNWTIRNVGWLGSGDLGDHGYQMLIRDSGGGTSTVENIYLNGKPGSEMGGAHVGPNHSGHINFRRTHIEGYGNNAAYCETFGRSGGSGGSVSFQNCYHRDNTVSQYRIGTAECVVENSVGVVNDPNLERGSYPYSSSHLARGVWAWHEDGMTVRNCSFDLNSNDGRPSSVFHARQNDDSPSGDTTLYVEDTYVNSDATLERTDSAGGGSASVQYSNLMNGPTISVMDEGVPTSADMAANGGYENPDPWGEGDSAIDEDPGGGTGTDPGSGGGSSAPFGVQTDPAESVNTTSATLRGQLTGLGDEDSADVSFEYRRAE